MHGVGLSLVGGRPSRPSVGSTLVHVTHFGFGCYTKEAADALCCEAGPPLEVASIDCFTPCRHDWVAHNGVVELDGLVCVFTFIQVVCKKMRDIHRIVVGWNDVVATVM